MAEYFIYTPPHMSAYSKQVFKDKYFKKNSSQEVRKWGVPYCYVKKPAQI